MQVWKPQSLNLLLLAEVAECWGFHSLAKLLGSWGIPLEALLISEGLPDGPFLRWPDPSGSHSVLGGFTHPWQVFHHLPLNSS